MQTLGKRYDLTSPLNSTAHLHRSTDSPTTKPRKQQPISKRQTRQSENKAKQKKGQTDATRQQLAGTADTGKVPTHRGGKVDHQTAETMLDTWASRLAPARTPWAFDAKAKQEWRKRLTDYQPPIARETWEQWRRHNDQWPSLYTFDDMLKARTRAGQHNDDCSECDNTGWVEAPDFEARGHTYTASQPCTCKHGQQRRSTRVWMERNA